LNKTEKKEYLKCLLKEKERIFKTMGYFNDDEEHANKKEVGGVPTHIADLGTDVFEKNLELDLSNSEGKILQAVNEAIEKIEHGKYGVCEVCGKPIPKSRLEALPYAKHCISCQRDREKSGE